MTEVLSVPNEGRSYFSPKTLSRPPSSSPSLFSLNTSNPYCPSSTLRHADGEFSPSPTSTTPSPVEDTPVFSKSSSFTSTPASSLSLDPRSDLVDEHDIQFPSFDTAKYDTITPAQKEQHPIHVAEKPELDPRGPQRRLFLPLLQTVHDDHAIEDEPTRHVDYLSYQWKEEDIWSSWRYIVTRRHVYGNSVRLENASWRTWTKLRCRLRTISPETLNWLKDCDVTWLYGPLHTDSRKSLNRAISSTPSHLSTSSSFINKKPILKKKSASQTILQRSISSHSLLKQAGAMLQAQQAGLSNNQMSFGRASSDLIASSFSGTSAINTPAVEESVTPVSTRLSATSSGLVSPSERRHIHFNNEVEQCIAVESKEDDDPADGARFCAPFGNLKVERPEEQEEQESDETEADGDDGVLMMKVAASTLGLSNRSTPRNSFSSESKTIKPLPSTTLKYRGDTPEPNEMQQSRALNMFWPRNKTLAPSSSQETLRPSSGHANFLLDNDDDDEDFDMEWQPSRVFPPTPYGEDASSTQSIVPPHEEEYDPPGMRRTPSGMFMPYDEDEEEAAMNNTMLGRVVDTVNTAKDIAHVIWNVGWRH